jgi:hypothetical protein
MYATCLFCNGNLGRNEVIEAFPVGRRLAFDAAKGRLWVVCRKCERWNLTPLEERWEAIEACERAFRATTLRVSTDEIGMARLKEGLELVRIGAPQRPEMAAWRYGDQFGRRRRRHIALVAGGVAVAGIVVVAGPMLGLVSAGAINPALNLFNAARGIYRARTFIRIPGDDDGAVLRMRLGHLEKVRVAASGDAFVLRVPTDPTRGVVPWWHFDRSIERHELRELTGGAALRAAGALLPRLNQAGGSASEVQRAVGLLEANATPDRLFRGAAERRARGRRRSESVTGDESLLSKLPRDLRLALEMAAHEESERRALEGELHLLEAAWRDAEEIAGIADDMFLPASVDEDLARLKRQRDAGPTDAGSG